MGIKYSFVDLCSGIGGLKYGLVSFGWNCLKSIDHDPDMVEMHRMVAGSCDLHDITKINPELIPKADFLVAGFPCQPFSSSGNKLGFNHKSGNVFESILKFIDYIKYEYLLFENVEGLLKNQQGYTFAKIILLLIENGYRVQWCTIDANQLGVVQTRPRLFIFCHRGDLFKNTTLEKIDLPSLFFNSYLKEHSLKPILHKKESLESIITEREPAIGRKAVLGDLPFGNCGFAAADSFISWKFKVKVNEFPEALGDICCPKFSGKLHVKSVRFYARGGPTKPHFRNERVAHCLGGTIGAAPTFAVPLTKIKDLKSRDAVLERSNWHREQDSYLIFRLKPEAALELFGKKSYVFKKAFLFGDVSNTKKYIILGNMVSTDVANYVAKLITSYISNKLLK